MENPLSNSETEVQEVTTKKTRKPRTKKTSDDETSSKSRKSHSVELKPKKERVLKPKPEKSESDTETKTNPNLNALISFLNDYYKNKKPLISFAKDDDEKKKKSVFTVKLSSYEAAFKLTPKINLETVTDFRLFTCLSKSGNLNSCVDELKFEKPPVFNIDYYISEVQKLFSPENVQKLKIKLYNDIFPHGYHLSEQEIKSRYELKYNKTYTGNYKTGVNVVYLQHCSKYFDAVLKQLIDGKDEAFIFKYVREQFATNDLVNTSLLSKQEKERLITQVMRHPEIITRITNRKIKDLHACDKTGRLTDNELQNYEKVNILNLLRELSNASHLVHIFENGKKSEPEVSISECYQTYLSKVEQIQSFDFNCEDNVEDFTRLLVRFCVLVYSLFKKQDVLKFCPTISPKFSRKAHKLIGMLLQDQSESLVKDLTEELKTSLLEVKDNNFYNLPVYQKVSKLVCEFPEKDKQIAVGIAVVGYVLEQVEKIKLSVNHKEIKINMTV
jgi:hypothetical protein